jgi:hypothetical protein
MFINRGKIKHCQKLLSMYRSILAGYLRQRELWGRFEAPDFLSIGITSIRKDIEDVKICLHRWKVAAIDHPDDMGSDDNFAREVKQQRDLLNIHRMNLRIYLKQQKQFSEDEVPHIIISGLKNELREIQRIKAMVRSWNITADDLLEEDEENFASHSFQEVTLPGNAKVEYQQKLLAMYRSLLAEHLRQRDLWGRGKILEFLSDGISAIRNDIVDVKGRLRGWKIDVTDHPDDEEPDDDLAAKVQHHRSLLKIYRTNLEIYLKQQEQFGESLAPPMIFHALQNARDEIQRIKAILRGWNVAVEDLPEED